MLNLFYSNKLITLLKDFTNLTGMPVTIYDESFAAITYTRAPSFCSNIGENSALAEQCSRCNTKALERCRKTQKTYIYRCHLGIIEAVTPVIKDGQIIGYIMIGQVLDTNDKGDILSSILSKLQNYFDTAFIKKQIKNINSMNISRIYSAVSIMETFTDYIVSKGYINARSLDFMDKLNHYIDENISGKITVEALCDFFHVCRTTLYKLIQPYSSEGIGAYILNRRLDKARSLLETTSLSVKEIALSVGFQDHTYFSRVYKNKYGVSPYRRTA
ncbi:MAG: helix-turn-helix domain-containing protein [Ruminococcaceae bacterium]|nr:helix-turn-helix domain-containing protein [Oscillospiraceae bacterium]